MNRKDVVVEIGNKIRRMRMDKGISQEKLAELSGIERPTLSKIERGKAEAGIRKLARIAAALGSNLSELFEGVDVGMD